MFSPVKCHYLVGTQNRKKKNHLNRRFFGPPCAFATIVYIARDSHVWCTIINVRIIYIYIIAFKQIYYIAVFVMRPRTQDFGRAPEKKNVCLPVFGPPWYKHRSFSFHEWVRT